MKKVTGGNLPATIWANFMKQAMADKEVAYIPTNYEANDTLPWLAGGGGATDNTAPAAGGAKPDGVELGPGFWDKLFGGDVKYEYPSDRR